MRMLAQDRAFYLNLRVDETDDAEALRRLRELEGIDRIRKEVGSHPLTHRIHVPLRSPPSRRCQE